jgi:hypothetical protein
MKLIYINELGPDYKGEKIYEFIFSKNTDSVYGEDWDLSPASGRPKPPALEHIEVVATISDSELALELVQASDYFSVLDAVDGVIALGWESYEDASAVDENLPRLVFPFGEELQRVQDKLSARNLKVKTAKVK